MKCPSGPSPNASLHAAVSTLEAVQRLEALTFSRPRYDMTCPHVRLNFELVQAITFAIIAVFLGKSRLELRETLAALVLECRALWSPNSSCMLLRSHLNLRQKAPSPALSAFHDFRDWPYRPSKLLDPRVLRSFCANFGGPQIPKSPGSLPAPQAAVADPLEKRTSRFFSSGLGCFHGVGQGGGLEFRVQRVHDVLGSGSEVAKIDHMWLQGARRLDASRERQWA